MRLLVLHDGIGGEAWLTNESSSCRFGAPVLEIAATQIDGSFGPADIVSRSPQPCTAAEVVAGWARQAIRTAEERELAAQFLGQWPGGPQIDS